MAVLEKLTGAELKSLHRTMVRIRAFEERAGEGVAAGEIVTPCHLYIGQEAVAAGVCAALNRDDYIFGTHRSHGHYLAKGGDMNALMAEIYGRATGCSTGKGGSMHLVAPEIGVLGTSSIVGGSLPLAVGAGLAAALRGDGRVSVCFFGDGATDGGVFHESLSFAACHKLPVILVCENNLYASHLHLRHRQPTCDICTRAASYGVPSDIIDGNDVLQVLAAASRAIKRARAGEGASFIECKTYRWRGHVGPNWDIDKGLRSQEEVDDWVARCPIKAFEKLLTSQGLANQAELTATHESAKAEVEAAVRFARESPYPHAGELHTHLFAD